MGIFKKLRRKVPEDPQEIYDLQQYEIEIICNEPIKYLNRKNIKATTFERSVNMLRIESIEEKIEGDDGEEKVAKTPEIIFYLRAPFSNKLSGMEIQPKISLDEAMIDGEHLVCSKASPREEEMMTENIGGNRIATKLVYDLHIFTPDSLEKAGQDYQEYTENINRIRKETNKKLERLRELHKKESNEIEKRHLEEIERYKEQVKQLNKENFKLLNEVPRQMNNQLKDMLKRKRNLRI